MMVDVIQTQWSADKTKETNGYEVISLHWFNSHPAKKGDALCRRVGAINSNDGAALAQADFVQLRAGACVLSRLTLVNRKLCNAFRVASSSGEVEEEVDESSQVVGAVLEKLCRHFERCTATGSAGGSATEVEHVLKCSVFLFCFYKDSLQDTVVEVVARP